jgi:hypothetical protein
LGSDAEHRFLSVPLRRAAYAWGPHVDLALVHEARSQSTLLAESSVSPSGSRNSTAGNQPHIRYETVTS